MPARAWRAAPRWRAPRAALWVAITGVIAYSADWFAMQFTLPGSIVAVVYPTMGICIAIGILVGPWVALGPLVGELVITTPLVGSPVVAAGMAVSGSMQIFLVSYVTRRFLAGRDALETRRSVVRFAAAAGVFGTVVSATGGVGSLHLAGFIPREDLLMSWVTWWAADVVSVVLITSAVLVWSRPSTDLVPPLRERLLLAAGASGIAIAIFAWPFHDSTFLLAMLGLPVVGWAAFRFGSRAVVSVSLLLAAAAFAHLLVPWRAGPAAVQDLLQSQTFIALAAVFGLVVAASVREERERMRAAAEREFAAVNDARNRLLRSFAHELNNPLTPVRLQLELLMLGHAGDLTAEQASGLAVIDRNTLRLSKLVRDLRDVSLLQAGDGLRLATGRLDVARVARDVVESYRAAAASAGVRIDLADVGPAVVAGDADRLAQVVMNLVDNAIKYSPAGGAVRVAVDARGEEAVVSVEDEGCGLSAGQLARLFTPFGQVQPKEIQKGGTGLGLHIARGIVESHGGELTCRSAGIGRGATFTVSLPLAHASEKPGRAPAARGSVPT